MKKLQMLTEMFERWLRKNTDLLLSLLFPQLNAFLFPPPAHLTGVKSFVLIGLQPVAGHWTASLCHLQGDILLEYN